MYILAFETSCDETAVALLQAENGLTDPQFKILKNLVFSQIKIHQPFGGVVPMLAQREHLKNLPVLLALLLKQKPSLFNQEFIQSTIFRRLDLISVTTGPGLEPCLWTGIKFAKDLYEKIKIYNKKIKLMGVNHLAGHLYSFLLTASNKKKLKFPLVALLASGGHTLLLLMEDLTTYKKLGETRDDAIGECLDKVARLLGLNYPGGPALEKLAKKGKATAIDFPRPMLKQKNYDFSFSGLKTAVLYHLKGKRKNSRLTKKEIRQIKVNKLTIQQRADIAASFQQAAFEVLIEKTLKAVKEFKAKTILLAGGVAANKTLQTGFKKNIKKQKLTDVNLIVPAKKFCTDNAAMIAVAGYINYLQGKKHRLIAQGNLTI